MADEDLGSGDRHCAFTVVPVWEIDAAVVIAARRTGLYPLLPLMRWAEPAPDLILEQSQALILEQVTGRETRADAYVALQVLSGIVYPPELVHHILTRRELMLESPVYEEILEEGRREGWQEGREEGWENALHENILTLLTLRLGAVPEELAAQVHQVKDAERLEALFRRAVVVDSVAAFTRGLAEGTAPR